MEKNYRYRLKTGMIRNANITSDMEISHKTIDRLKCLINNIVEREEYIPIPMFDIELSKSVENFFFNRVNVQIGDWYPTIEIILKSNKSNK